MFLMKHFYYNEKRGYLLPESGAFLYVFVAYFRLLIAFFCFLLVFYDSFPRIDDTSMILFSLFSEKSHSIKESESQIYNIHFSLNNETLILFSRKIIYVYARDESFALPTILLDAKTLLTHKGHPKTYKKY